MRKIFVAITVHLVLCIIYSMPLAIYGVFSPEPIFADEDKKPSVIYSGAKYRSPFESWLPRKEGVKGVPTDKRRPARDAGGIIRLPDFVVNGIIWGGRFPQAIINHTVVRVGDKIENVEIIQIDKDRIELLFEGETFFIPDSPEIDHSGLPQQAR